MRCRVAHLHQQAIARPNSLKVSARRSPIVSRVWPTALDQRWIADVGRLLREPARRRSLRKRSKGLERYPDNVDLWVGAGNALVAHGGSVMSPAAALAFDEAASAIEPSRAAFLCGPCDGAGGDLKVRTRYGAGFWRTRPMRRGARTSRCGWPNCDRRWGRTCPPMRRPGLDSMLFLSLPLVGAPMTVWSWPGSGSAESAIPESKWAKRVTAITGDALKSWRSAPSASFSAISAPARSTLSREGFAGHHSIEADQLHIYGIAQPRLLVDDACRRLRM